MATLSQRQIAAKAEATLRALLRAPKSRRGLIAAVKAAGLSENFVYGFLSEAERRGEVVKLKAGPATQYQLAERFHMEQPEEGLWPTWLDPRTLPAINGRRVFLAGKPAEEQQEEAEEACD